MAIPEFLTKAVGHWATKDSKLMMHGQPERSSESKLTVATAVLGRFAVLSYSWKFDGQVQEGVLLLGGNKEEATASWVDSFHTGGGFMPLRGEQIPGRITLLGSYAAPPGPDWKWRFVISDEDSQIKFAMTNISPDGQEEPAVEAAYKRA